MKQKKKKKKKKKIILNNGYLGFYVDEERSKM